MIRLKYPNRKQLDKFKDHLLALPYSYDAVGASNADFPPNFNHDYNKVFLGKGEEVWENAKAALQNWQQFPRPWTAIYSNVTPLEKDEVVVVGFHLFGFWWFNGARIVYAFDEADRYGFAYGTLTKHVEIGEEYFGIERNAEGEIHYHIKAFSRPNYWYVKLAKPLARFYQGRFVRQSFEAMKTLATPSKVHAYASEK
ncbi:MAG: DUF1990 domain-containing protein [Bacteroidota bacterium]